MNTGISPRPRRVFPLPSWHLDRACKGNWHGNTPPGCKRGKDPKIKSLNTISKGGRKSKNRTQRRKDIKKLKNKGITPVPNMRDKNLRMGDLSIRDMERAINREEKQQKIEDRVVDRKIKNHNKSIKLPRMDRPKPWGKLRAEDLDRSEQWLKDSAKMFGIDLHKGRVKDLSSSDLTPSDIARAKKKALEKLDGNQPAKSIRDAFSQFDKNLNDFFKDELFQTSFGGKTHKAKNNIAPLKLSELKPETRKLAKELQRQILEANFMAQELASEFKRRERTKASLKNASNEIKRFRTKLDSLDLEFRTDGIDAFLWSMSFGNSLPLPSWRLDAKRGKSGPCSEDHGWAGAKKGSCKRVKPKGRKARQLAKALKKRTPEVDSLFTDPDFLRKSRKSWQSGKISKQQYRKILKRAALARIAQRKEGGGTLLKGVIPGGKARIKAKGLPKPSFRDKRKPQGEKKAKVEPKAKKVENLIPPRKAILSNKGRDGKTLPGGEFFVGTKGGSRLVAQTLRRAEEDALNGITGLDRFGHSQTNRRRALIGYMAPPVREGVKASKRDLRKHFSVDGTYLAPILDDKQAMDEATTDVIGRLAGVAQIKGAKQVSMQVDRSMVASLRKLNDPRFRLVRDRRFPREMSMGIGLEERESTKDGESFAKYHLVANVQNGQAVKPSLEEIKAAKSRQILDRLRDMQFDEGVRKVYSKGADAAPQPRFGLQEAGSVKQRKGVSLTQNFAREERLARAVEKLDNKISGRKPGKGIKDFSLAEVAKAANEAKRWNAEQGFEPLKADDTVNGFSQAQALAHDIAHPIALKAVGKSSKQVKEFYKTQTLVPEEAIVNAFEHLSRGDTLEASVQSGMRLSRVLSRDLSDEEKTYFRSSEYATKIREDIEKGYMHPDHHLDMAIIRNKNRVADTVFQGGEDFNNPLDPSNGKPLSVKEQNAKFTEIRTVYSKPYEVQASKGMLQKIKDAVERDKQNSADLTDAISETWLKDLDLPDLPDFV